MNIWAAQTTQHNEYGFRFYGKVPTLEKGVLGLTMKIIVDEILPRIS